MNTRKLALVKVLALIGIVFAAASLGAQTPVNCTTSGSTITSTTDCYAQPDEYYMTVYQVGLCTAQPGAPTTSTAADFSKCAIVYSDANGTRVQVTKGASTALSTGTITRPANGAYTYGYIIIAPQFEVKVTKTFSTARMAFQGGGGTGTVCWTKTGSEYVYSSASTNLPVDCGATAGTAGITAHKQNSFSPMTVQGVAAQPTYTFSPGTGINAYLVTTDNKLGSQVTDGTMGTVAKLLGIMSLSVTVSDSTGSVNTSFNVTQGTTIIQSSGNIFYFGGGPFDLVMALP